VFEVEVLLPKPETEHVRRKKAKAEGKGEADQRRVSPKVQT
jgi:hypothetical protein